MQTLNINTAKIDKTALYQGKTGKFLSLTLMENRDGPDQYGNDGFIVQDIGKDRREAGERGPIIGNWKHIGQKPADPKPAPARQPASRPAAEQDDDDSDIPF